MRKLLIIMKTIFYMVFWTFLIYGLFLLLNESQGLIVTVISLIACFLMCCVGMIGLLNSNRTWFFKYNKQELISLMVIVMTIGVSTTLFSISNHILHTTLDYELSPKMKSQYYSEALIYEREFMFKRISFLKTLETKTTEKAVVFHEMPDAGIAKQAISHIRKVHALNEKFIARHDAAPVKVILYRNPLIFQKQLPLHSYENLHALYVPAEKTIHLLVTNQMDEESSLFLELIGHEYTHHWIVSYLAEHGLDNRHLPRWFEEGIAEYMGEKSIRKIPRFVPLNLIPFTRLDTVGEWSYENRRNSSHHPYRQSYYAIDQFVRDGNKEKIQTLLLNKEQNFYQLFEREMGESILAFEVRFLRDEMKEYRENRQ
ncbi:hypothetical protein KUV80_07210 [Fictibacillus nanhaiensis]|uniref:hypothetical protein n=1 Tax=Fictibacillus nanhaiensis TaxID=742169 RepID=UPI001C965444|nr:hypothetical protein [Fictibacillus nanhaiensis]MBY6036435.1 hypothetical protein [Fictibacillus nanhaiensis]